MIDLRHDPATLDPIELATASELAALQLERLRWTLRHAYENVPVYRAKFLDAGVHPDDCRSLEDLRRFPYTTKQDLRDAYPFGMLAVPRTRLARIHGSSGTTGRPTVVGYTASDIGTWSDLMARSIRAAGGHPGDLVHVAYGYGLFTGGLGAHYGAERLGCTVIPVSGGMTERQVRLIADFRPDIIMCTPSYLLTIIDEMGLQGIDPRTTGIKVGIFGAEPWTQDMRREIEERTGMHAVDIYGLSEVMGPGVSQECVEAKDGLHIWEDHFYPETIDPIDQAPVPDGEYGELVLTTLTREAMPVIRYRTRDLTRLLPGTVRTMRRMEKVTGRTDDMMIIRGVNVFPTQIEEQILRVPGLAPHYLCVIDRPGRLDELTIRVEIRSDDTREGERSGLADRLSRLVKQNVGVTVAVDVVPVGTLERSLGKARRIQDHRRNPEPVS